MGALIVIRDIIVAIYQRIGAKGVAAIVLIAVLLFQQHRINNYQVEVSTLNTTVSTQNESLKKQNEAILAIGRKRDELQGELDAASAKNSLLTDAFEKIRKQKLSQSVATTCDGAMTEVRSSAKDVAEKWNTK